MADSAGETLWAPFIGHQDGLLAVPEAQRDLALRGQLPKALAVSRTQRLRSNWGHSDLVTT